jgi:signal transduction histidine kinase
MLSTREREPGVLPTFRLFIGVQLVLTVLGMAHLLLAPHPPSSAIVTLALVSLLEPGVLFLYLSLPALRRSLGSLYLPLGIAWAVAGPILDPYINMNLMDLHPTSGNALELLVQVMLWRQTIVLLIPLVVLSWQYGIHQVAALCALTMALNIALVSQASLFREGVAGTLLGLMVVQTIVFFLVGHMIVKLMSVQRDQRQRLSEANTHLAQYASTLEQLTISCERNRLARELHDVLAHTLSGVAVELEGSRTMLRRDPDRADRLLGNSLQAIREGLAETRRALKELRARPLEDLGLALAVRALAEAYIGRFDVAIELDIDPDLGEYPAEVQQSVYRIAQEALNNIAEHAQARHARLILKRVREQLQLVVCDDGCGFDPATSADDPRYGLLGMRERSSMIGGSLVVESQRGKGTRVSFSYGGSQ